jgi:hypothetical protein
MSVTVTILIGILVTVATERASHKELLLSDESFVESVILDAMSMVKHWAEKLKSLFKKIGSTFGEVISIVEGGK